MKPVDNLKRPLIDLPKITGGIECKQTSASNQWAGVSTIASGDTTVVVSTTKITSDANVQITGFSNVASHRSLYVTVQSITDGTNFTLRAEAATVDSYRVGWVIFNQLTN